MKTPFAKCYELLEENGPMTTVELAAAIEYDFVQLRRILRRKERDGYLQVERVPLQEVRPIGMVLRWAVTDKHYDGVTTTTIIVKSDDGNTRQFNTVRECAQALNVADQNVYSALRHGWRAGGCTIERAEV